ncbi:RecT family recombinase [Acinetobacter parvus]|uniref:RecT family recombinase n=1 Tax=Acinetobacter parvus TaxID=134533 RepID=UPI0021D21A40|nr:RecT family recombinase [Acinetobacter parvus]MCU4393356.1 recombinase RecT [Acinetobacter parvus]
MNASTDLQVPHSTQTTDLILDFDALEKIERFAAKMAKARGTVPAHIAGNEGDCMAIVMQSMQWGMNPFAVAQKTFSIKGVLGYEAQLINAVITARAPIKERLQFEWIGTPEQWDKVIGNFEEKTSTKKQDEHGNAAKYRVPKWNIADERPLGVKVWATLRGEDNPRELTIMLSQARTRNSTLWVDDPKQQLAYLAVKRWARLYCPDVILGVYSPDELLEREEMDVTPAQSTAKKHQGASGLKAQMAEREQSQETVIDMAPNFDVEGLINQINVVTSLDELKTLAKTFPTDLGEPAETDIKKAYANQKFYLQLINDLEVATSIEAINSIMEKQFEPNTSFLTDAQIDEVSALFERKSAELTP